MATEKGYLRKLRYGVQFAFFLLTLHIGYRFYQFVLHFSEQGHPFVQRPPSVDAFLPISGLMSLKFFLFTGIIEPLHPAAFFMFVAIVIVSLLMKKGFCGWICPVGTLSQFFWMTGEKVFGRNFRMEKYTDGTIRSIEYILMALFLFVIGIAMVPNMMVLFFITDYYKTADVRTMNVFTQMSVITLCVLVIVGGLSLVYKNFWCRYLCPYGAFLGLLSCASPVKIKRNNENCIHCRACSNSCPSLLDVEQKELISSPECFSCMTCLSSCPSRDALHITLKTGKVRKPFKPYLHPLFLVLILYLIIGVAMLSGKWHSQIPYEEYKRIIPELTKQ
ncbi:MAG TPA: 4Fe-4S binding protein [Thermodesulfovibrionales bacterium]|nr:4Fe-4S binding protein [Thermodesulfovibrionales bacterium]